ncbi:MAG TPA: SDR family NAD(P)-dependent oxidoreductase [Acetobacteraceae bacterium]|nr:SDR family NAD(P)-dependent oxidoreductase [Acetobacteraceae bacterium]
MARVFITGSADNLGLVTARQLVAAGHRVMLHARNPARAEDARRALPQADAVAVGDVAEIATMRHVAEQVNAWGRCDAVIHNVGVGSRDPRVQTSDGLSRLFAVNVLAPYVLTALIARPERLVYLSSGLHTGGSPDLDDPQFARRRWSGSQAYADSKLLDVMLAFAVARLWPDVRSNAVTPGWVPTRMGGRGAPEDLEEGAATQAWLAVTDDPAARVSGAYWYHRQQREPHKAARDVARQDALLAYCAGMSGVKMG